ncbi:MAG: hypothetical protein KatS3mg105_1083 [Gemmatales bacterium]|nr:MAG: hypothetical protein KatS3mg105_1083 [Gemmatales bacterium]
MPKLAVTLVETKAATQCDDVGDVSPSAQRERTAWWESFLESGPVDVSVCIVNWNCRDLLRGCLESVHDQPQGVRVETIVVDNASSDGSAEMVASHFPEVTLIRNTENVGYARGNNQAARVARGKYLFFLNNDTRLPAFTLRRLLDYADAHTDVAILAPRLRDGAGKTQASWRRRPTLATFLHQTCLLRWTNLFRSAYRRYRRQAVVPTAPQSVDVLMGAAMMIPRKLFFENGQWNESFRFGGEDLELCHRFGKRFRLVYHPQIEIVHYGRASTRQNISFTSVQIPVGFVRYLRISGCHEAGIFLYKLVLTLDAPLHAAVKALQYVCRRLRGRRNHAEKSLLVARGLIQFLCKGLVPFWKA